MLMLALMLLQGHIVQAAEGETVDAAKAAEVAQYVSKTLMMEEVSGYYQCRVQGLGDTRVYGGLGGSFGPADLSYQQSSAVHSGLGHKQTHGYQVVSMVANICCCCCCCCWRST
jgi:hypothetical protein